ncbi:hypothetical protein M901_0058 [Bacteriovorax sp. DB6_IX]|nr:hypothetical protein M901_0058 [Bacteriovorax sp. DB6_IX]
MGLNMEVLDETIITNSHFKITGRKNLKRVNRSQQLKL